MQTAQQDLERTALHEAIYKGNQETVELLLKKGTALHQLDKFGRTPLATAALLGRQSLVELLLKWDAQPNELNMSNEIPLHEAARKGYLGITKLLLERGSQINIKNIPNQCTSLDLAVRENHTTVAELLLSKGAMVDSQANKNHNSLYFALQHHFNEITVLLLRHGAYSYRHDIVDTELTEYWKPPLISKSCYTTLYRTLLFAGASAATKRLPAPLSTIKEKIEAIVALWLKPLHLSRAECKKNTPKVLRALPRLNYWLSVVSQKEREREQDLDQLKPPEFYKDEAEQMLGLKHFFLISETEQEYQTLVLKQLQERKISMELLLSIREKLIVRVLADTLVKVYKLPYRVASYLATEARACPESYHSFHKQLFGDDWEAACVPSRLSLRL